MCYFCAMNTSNSSESGFVRDSDSDFRVLTGMTDVEILRVSKTNIIARGRRYGRLWFLKGLRPEVRDSNVNRRQLQKEFEIHSRLLDVGVVQAVSLEIIGELGLCIVEEWIEGKTLAQLLQEGELTEKERRRIMREIIRAVGYINSRGVVHRDLKPENIMVRDVGGSVVIIDFGLADTDDYVELKQGAGTTGYISPEQISDRQARPSDDIYSLGVIMKQLCPGYNRIATQCTGPVDKRPVDAEALLKMIDARDRRPRRLLTVACGAVVVAGIAMLMNHYLELSDATERAQHRVAILSETNRAQELRVTELTDSLTGMTDRMNRAEDEIKRVDSYNASRARAYVEGCRKIDEAIKKFDRDIQSDLDNPSPEFYDKVGVMRKRVLAICEYAFDLKRFPELHEDDKYKLREELQDHFYSVYSSYYTEWQAKFYRDEVDKNWGPGGYAPKPASKEVNDTDSVPQSE